MVNIEQKCREIIEWAQTNTWARNNFDPTTIQNIYDDVGTNEYDWPSSDQERAVNNVYALTQRANKWR